MLKDPIIYHNNSFGNGLYFSLYQIQKRSLERSAVITSALPALSVIHSRETNAVSVDCIGCSSIVLILRMYKSTLILKGEHLTRP